MPANTRETVAEETPAAAATSRMVLGRDALIGFGFLERPPLAFLVGDDALFALRVTERRYCMGGSLFPSMVAGPASQSRRQAETQPLLQVADGST
ncbi:hypothetical protein ACIRPU_39415 [Streptomyces sp. NPDC102259]|uniref:hypothetical protein n=1 Tax=Streptomyces sp. NPDC102259 TaxID=3366148 RepID=UPI00380B6FDF